MLPHDGLRIVTLERFLSCADFIEDSSKRVQVAALVAGIALNLLRRDIERRLRVPVDECSSGYSQQFGNADIGEHGLTYWIM